MWVDYLEVNLTFTAVSCSELVPGKLNSSLNRLSGWQYLSQLVEADLDKFTLANVNVVIGTISEDKNVSQIHGFTHTQSQKLNAFVTHRHKSKDYLLQLNHAFQWNIVAYLTSVASEVTQYSTVQKHGLTGLHNNWQSIHGVQWSKSRPAWSSALKILVSGLPTKVGISEHNELAVVPFAELVIWELVPQWRTCVGMYLEIYSRHYFWIICAVNEFVTWIFTTFWNIW